jgi:hypothetical protein
MDIDAVRLRSGGQLGRMQGVEDLLRHVGTDARHRPQGRQPRVGDGIGGADG